MYPFHRQPGYLSVLPVPPKLVAGTQYVPGNWAPGTREKTGTGCFSREILHVVSLSPRKSRPLGSISYKKYRQYPGNPFQKLCREILVVSKHCEVPQLSKTRVLRRTQDARYFSWNPRRWQLTIPSRSLGSTYGTNTPKNQFRKNTLTLSTPNMSRVADC